MNKKMSDFTGMYKLSQTLKFELKPVGSTAENLGKSGLLEQDFKRADDYPAMKCFLDEQHKKFLEKVFSGIETVDWTGLAGELENFQKDNSRRTGRIFQYSGTCIQMMNICRQIGQITADQQNIRSVFTVDPGYGLFQYLNPDMSVSGRISRSNYSI